jgi:hypothetical protein
MEVDVEMQCLGKPTPPDSEIRTGGTGEAEKTEGPNTQSNPSVALEIEPFIEVEANLEKENTIPLVPSLKPKFVPPIGELYKNNVKRQQD